MPPKPRTPAAAAAAAAAAPSASTASDTPLFLPSALDDSDSDSDSDADSDSLDSPVRTEITPGLAPPPAPAPAAPSAPAHFTLSDDSSDGDSTNDSADDDDPVVCSYSIHITAPVAPDLYIFQYPVRSRQKPYTKAESSCPVEARFKPRAGLVEVDVPVNVHVNYDEEKGKAWGDVLRRAGREAAGRALPGGGGANKRRKVEEDDDDDDGAEDEADIATMGFAEALKKGRVLDRQTLGSRIQADNTKYMLGVFKNDQLHLTPITSTLQLRPQFHHVDTAVEAERAATKAARDASAPQKQQEARAVHLSVKNSDDPSSQLSNTMKALRVAEEEEWTKLHWVDQDTEDAWDMYEVSCLKEGQGGPLKNVTGKAEYMEWLSTGKPIVKKKEIKVEAV